MLIQFRFKNFKSFREDTILDLSATKITEHSERVISVGYEKILPTAAIFGANASGKSNVLEALRYMMTYVLESFSYGGEDDDRKADSRRLRLMPFLFDSKNSEIESSFEVYFMHNDVHGLKSYNYGFTLNQFGVAEEWLNSKAKTARTYKKIFYREGKSLDLTGLPKKSQELIELSLNREALIVSLGAKLKVNKLKIIRDWFYNMNFANFGDPYENIFLSRIVPKGFVDTIDAQKKVVNYLNAFDASIIGFDVNVLDEKETHKQIKIDTIHRTIDGGTASIPLHEESDGTLKMLALYPILQDTLETGSILFVDELNARLHPLLVRSFLLTFLNPEINVKHAQLIFTTHDAWQLSNDLLRRDEIWFTEKDAKGISTLYSLVDFIDEDGTKIRKDESYEKNYLLGKYGGIPSLRYFDMFKEVKNGEIK